MRKANYPGDSSIQAYSISYQYDVMGDLIKKLDSMGKLDLYIYDNLGRALSHTEENQDGSNAITTSTKYDKSGNKRFVTDGNGCTTENIYDKLNKLNETIIAVTEANGQKMNHTTSYTYDSNGNRQTETVTSNSGARVTTYSYNDQNRLTGAVISENGTITENDTFTYDNNGNQLTEVKIASINGVPGTAKKTQNIYDDLNQLVETINSDNIETDNTYNGEGTRVSKKVGNNTTNYLYEADKVILETDAKGNETARNVYGINLLTRTSNGQTAYYFYNGHADVISLSDSVSGNQLASYDYDEFGNMTKEEGTFDNPYRYAGYQYDSTTKDYYLMSRMYDPETGRFLQEDTYRGDPSDALSLNLYTYCHNEPMMYDDPTGHWFEWLKKAWSGIKSLGKAAKEIATNSWNDLENYVDDAPDNFEEFNKELGMNTSVARRVAGISAGFAKFGLGVVKGIGFVGKTIFDGALSGNAMNLVSDKTLDKALSTYNEDGQIWKSVPKNIIMSAASIPQNTYRFFTDANMTTKEIANNTNDILNTTMVAYGTYKAGANIADYTKAGASIAKQIPDVVKTAIADSKETIQLGTQSELAGFGGYGNGLSLNVIRPGEFFDSIRNGFKSIMQDSSLGDGNLADPNMNGKTLSVERGVSFFSADALRFINKDNATLGPENGLTWFTTLDDAAKIRNVGDVARETGMARSVQDAYVSGKDVYGISFPTDGLEIRLPNATDAGGWPHFLEGGHTAVRGGAEDTGFYMINQTRELVTPGGLSMPKGSVLFKLGENGSWTKIKEWK